MSSNQYQSIPSNHFSIGYNFPNNDNPSANFSSSNFENASQNDNVGYNPFCEQSPALNINSVDSSSDRSIYVSNNTYLVTRVGILYLIALD